jgi:hypothetical protein
VQLLDHPFFVLGKRQPERARKESYEWVEKDYITVAYKKHFTPSFT